jgi:uncharacterized protein (TIGR00369 family)
MSVEQAQAAFARMPFAAFLGMTIVELTEERAVVLLPYHPEHANAVGPLNGGASAALLNSAGTLAAWTGLDLDTALHTTCVNMTVHYLNAALEEDVLAEARILRRGRDLFFLDVALRTPANKPICQGLMLYRAPDYAGHAPRLHAEPHLLPTPKPLQVADDAWLFQGYVQKLGIAPQHSGPGRLRLHMPGVAAHTDERGHIHAGALASIVDIAGTGASWSLIPQRKGARGSTIGMHVSYTSNTTGAVVADAHVQQRSEEIFFSTVHVTTVDTGQLVAMGEVSYRLLEPRDAV